MDEFFFKQWGEHVSCWMDAIYFACDLFCLGTTKDGHPRHPLYVPASQELVDVEHILAIETDGAVTFLWSDDLAPLRDLGRAHLRRASHVEPTEEGHWTADLSPVGGPVLGPFSLRSDALEAERSWLLEHHL